MMPELEVVVTPYTNSRRYGGSAAALLRVVVAETGDVVAAAGLWACASCGSKAPKSSKNEYRGKRTA